jgi:predicted metalloprotease
MRWDDFRQSDNVEDRRGESHEAGGGGFHLPMGGGGLGIGTLVILGLVGWALGIDPRILIGGAEILTGGNRGGYEQPYRDPMQQQRQQQRQSKGAPTDDMGRFVAGVLGETEDRWKEIFQQGGAQYREPRLVMFTGATRTDACGVAQSAMGPFYCPGEQRIYLDTSFFRDIERRFRGCDAGSKACQFAQAYVIAHEVGHHVQNQLGILGKVQQAQRGVSKTEANRLQVKVELQADCFAGVWANRSEQKWKFLEPGDVEAALRTAAAIGDDRLQKQSQGYAVPDSFTHGSSEQRQRWFQIGLKSGSVQACNTFNASQL